MDKIKLNSCFTISKKMSASNIEFTNDKISNLIIKNPDLFSEFKQKSDKPLSICKDDSLGNFIKSDYNTEGDSCRSPWSNKYFPDVDVPKFPPNELRELEVLFNKIFKEYARLYYGDKAVSSVFVWEQGESIESGFSCALSVKNTNKDDEWDANNLVNVKFFKEKEKNVERIKALYKLTSTVLFKVKVNSNGVEMSGSLTKIVEESHYIKTYLENETHIDKIGKLVEFTENNLKNQIDEIYIKKTTEIVNKLRKTDKTGRNAYFNPATSTNLFQLFNNR